ncbi:hypothetical protein BDK51DRAFT_14076, partial [Blyttiomyces helicus]
EELQLQVLVLGVACLYAFLQTNWTGPVLSVEPEDLLPEEVREHREELRKRALAALTEDGEEPYSLTQRPGFLLMARTLLVEGSPQLGELKTVHWWKARCLLIQQRILDNPTETLHSSHLMLFKAQSRLPAAEPLNKEVLARFNLETGLAHHWYSQDKDAVAGFTSAEEVSGFKWSLSGALGKRTKFQTFNVAQLVVLAESAADEDAESASTAETVAVTGSKPTNLDLNDDTILETIEFTAPKEGENGKHAGKQGNLKAIDQCILLAFCLNVKNTNPANGLTTEQMLPYVRRVLENANNWMVYTMALLLRSRLESHKSRTVERAALQLQALVDQFPLEESTPAERMLHIFSIMMPPKWELERELGERFVSIGVLRSAFEIFQRLELWEDAISCLQMLEKPKEAEALVRQRLELSPKSPKLHCLLGDLSGNASFYEMAWQLSDGRYPRAMRSLGGYYFKRGEWVKSIESYHRALAINALFENSWFIMGCAAMRAEDWDTAVRAFSRTVSINHENGEAWTYLASVY